MSRSRSDEYGPRIDLPDRVGLCPIHGEHFYMPLNWGDMAPTCPECSFAAGRLSAASVTGEATFRNHPQ